MTVIPKQDGDLQKYNTNGEQVRRFVLNCHEGSTVWQVIAWAIAPDCGSAATGRKLQRDIFDAVLKLAYGLLARDFRVGISHTIGIGRSAVRFATDSRLEQTSGSPFVTWHAKSGRVFFVSSGGD